MPNYPAPTAIKEARGTVRRDRANAAEPKPATLEVGARPPSWLKGARRRRAWTELAELLRGQRLLTVLDAAGLALLVDAYGDYLEASDLVMGSACGHCGLPVSSKQPCTATVGLDAPAEDDVDEELEPQPQGGALKRRHRDAADARVVAIPHDPGRRYYTTRTKEGSLMIRPHPALAVRGDAWKRVATMLREFGMTPSARTRVTATEGAADDPFDGFLRAGVA